MDDRYERQLVISEVGEAGQERLGKARVLVVGAGGLGSAILFYLAAAGVGVLGIADDDKIVASNLNRQILYTTQDLGRSKALTAVQRVRELNPSVKAVPHEFRVLRENGLPLVQQYDLVVDASDNLETKGLMNELCVEAGIPFVWAAVSRFEGQMGVYTPGHACRACVFPVLPQPGTYPSPAELGIVGAAAGVMGALEATEVLKAILGAGDLLLDSILLWDGLYTSFEVVRFQRDPTCPVCSGQ